MSTFLFLLLIPVFFIPNIALEVRTPKFLLLFLCIFLFFLFKSRNNDYKIHAKKAPLIISIFSSIFIIPSLIYGNLETFWFYAQIFFPLLYIAVKKKSVNFKTILIYTVISSLIVSFIGILNFYGMSPYEIIFSNSYNRNNIISTVGNVNYVSNYLASIIPLLIVGILILKNKIINIFSFISLILSLFTVLIGQTRSVYFALFISLLLMLIIGLLNKKIRIFLKIKYKRIIIILLAITISILLFINPPGVPEDQKPFDKMFGRIASVISADFDVGSAYQRQLEWQTGIEMFKDSPVFGFGLGSYKLLSTDYQEKFTASEGKYFGHFDKPYEAHSDIIQILSETGIIGMMLFIFFIVYIYKGAIRRILKGNIIILSYLAVISVILIHSFTEFPFHMMPSVAIFTFFSSEIISNKSNIRIKKGMNFILILISIILLFFAVRYFLSSSFYVAGDIKLKEYDHLFSEYNRKTSGIDYENNYILNNSQKKEMSEFKKNYEKIRNFNIKNEAENISISAFFNLKTSYFMNEKNYFTIVGLYNAYYNMKKIGLTENYVNLSDEIEYVPSKISEIRDAPNKIATINSLSDEFKNSTEIKSYYNLYKIICLSLNVPTDYNTYYYIGVSSYNLLSEIKDDLSEEEYDLWIEWFRYGYERALKMKRLDTYGLKNNWKNIDLEYLIRLEYFGELNVDDLQKVLEDRDKIRKYAMDRNWTFSMDLYDYLKEKTNTYKDISEYFVEVYKRYYDYYSENKYFIEEKYNTAKDLKIKMDLKDREYIIAEYFTIQNFMENYEKEYL